MLLILIWIWDNIEKLSNITNVIIALLTLFLGLTLLLKLLQCQKYKKLMMKKAGLRPAFFIHIINCKRVIYLPILRQMRKSGL